MAAAGFALMGLALTACGNNPQSSLNAAGIYARRADNLFNKVFIIVVIVFVLVEGAIVTFLVKYRERPGGPTPVQIHGHTRAEFIWTVIPAVILAGVAIPTVKLIFDFAAAPPASDRIDISVVGHQWWWEYQYKDSSGKTLFATANEMHIPAGRPVYLTLNSVDVIHAFWIPRLAGKQDVVPGHTNHITIEADPGTTASGATDTYFGQCSQYCGLSHANMRLRVIAHSQSSFDAWESAQEQPAPTPNPDSVAGKGLDLFLNGRDGSSHFSNNTGACASCHAVDGTKAAGVLGPNLTHVYSRQAFAGDTLDMNDANLRLWLANAPKEKPGSDMPNLGLTDQEISALLAYLQTLR